MDLRRRGAPAVAAGFVLLVACTHDFDAYTPASTSGVDSGATDSGTKTETSVPDATAPCTETGAVTYVGHCYFAITGNFDFDGAKSLCASKGGQLATITSAAERDVVRIVGNARERWIGLSRPPASASIDASYQWVGGEPRAGFADWSPGEPDGSGECVRLHTGVSDWGDEPCSAAHDALCERP